MVVGFVSGGVPKGKEGETQGAGQGGRIDVVCNNPGTNGKGRRERNADESMGCLSSSLLPASGTIDPGLA